MRSPLFAQEIGAGRHDRAQHFIYLGLKILLSLSLVVALAYFLIPDQILTLFRPRSADSSSVPFALILERGRVVLRYLAAWNICIVFYFLFRQSLRGAGDTRFFYFTAVLLDIGLFMGGIFIVLKLVGIHLVTLWSYFIFYFVFASLTYFLRFRLGHWRTADRAHLEQAHLL